MFPVKIEFHPYGGEAKARSLGVCIAAVLAFMTASNQPVLAAAPPRVAVLDFVTLWDVPEFGKESAVALRAALLKTGKYTVVERNIIEQALIGEGLLSPGGINQAAALKIGGLLNANYIGIGSMSSGLGEPYTMKVMFLDVETGAAVFGKKLTAENKDEIPALCGQLARSLLQEGRLTKKAKKPVKKDDKTKADPEPGKDARRWGMEFSGAGWKMDGKDFLKAAPYSRLLGSTVRIKQYELGGSAVFFIEGKSRFRFGLSAGYGVMPSVSYSSIYTHPPFLDYISEKISNETRYVPLDLYIKYKSRGGGFGFFAGGGADYLMARTTYDYYSYDPAYTPTQNAKKGEFTQSKAVPHAQAGCEWFISRRLSLNFGAKYLFSAALNNLRGKMTYNGVTDPEKYRMVMGYFPPPGEVYLISFDQASQPLGPGERLFRYDFSGLRGNFALRFYF